MPAALEIERHPLQPFLPENAQVLMLNFNFSLDFGTKHNEGWQRLNNEDTESGILSGAK